MTQLGQLLAKYKNMLLLILLSVTLAVSGYANRQRSASTAATVSIPVIEAATQPRTAMESYRLQRDQEAQNNMAALAALVEQPLLDDATRDAAAEHLQLIIEARRMQSALENALSNSSLAPCVAVVSAGNVTIVTEKSELTDKDFALVLTLAAAHAGASPENVRIIPAD